MKGSLRFVTAICAVRFAVASQWTRDLEEQRDAIELRLLGDESCGFGSVVFFNVQTQVNPTSGSSTCTKSENLAIGGVINTALRDVGIGDKKIDGVKFVAGVCLEPEADGMMAMRRLQNGYVWYGGGGCTSCGGDDDDRRKMQLLRSSIEVVSTDLKETFPTTVGPNIEEKLEGILKTTLQAFQCLGGTFDVAITVDAVYIWQLDLVCKGRDTIYDTILGV
eukprot:CAMPEP_0119003430 /NCGR_PEP_ID=MMETSP1176-20130426/554_1 /TAXON_ID=265551 /ORGANISM="Synedropsis recta cf, Strain CCMP1620" /LENGTH=220 /DNA_ID=CAMNT_0006955031 /DNA_START=51 /DNA_END=713 /DNA_ORIENTATION=+